MSDEIKKPLRRSDREEGNERDARRRKNDEKPRLTQNQEPGLLTEAPVVEKQEKPEPKLSVVTPQDSSRRRGRGRSKAAASEPTQLNQGILTARNASAVAPTWLLMLLAIVLSVSYVTFPLFERGTTGVQSQNIFSGWAMNHGAIPYRNFFGSEGVLFYLLNQLGNLFGTPALLWVFEVLSLFLVGRLSFQLVEENVENKTVSSLTAVISMIATAGLLLGGDYAVEFAIPLALYGLLFLDRYYLRGHQDEAFILFGISGAATALIYPPLAIIWVVGFIGLVITNLQRRLIGRSFYQFFASLFGALLVVYPVGFYTLKSQIFAQTVEQTLSIPLTHFMASIPLKQMGIMLGLLVIFGVAIPFLFGMDFIINRSKDKFWHTIIWFMGLVVLVYTLFSNQAELSHLAGVVPFAIVFIGTFIAKLQAPSFLKVLTSQALLPIFGLALLVGYPFYQWFNQDIKQDQEATIVSYLRDEHAKNVVSLTGDYSIYQQLGKEPVLATVPDHYPVRYQQSFNLKLDALEDSFVIVDKDKPVTDAIQTILDAKYEKVDLKDADLFEVYRNKDVTTEDEQAPEEESNSEEASSTEESTNEESSTEEGTSDSSGDLDLASTDLSTYDDGVVQNFRDQLTAAGFNLSGFDNQWLYEQLKAAQNQGVDIVSYFKNYGFSQAVTSDTTTSDQY